MGSASFPRTIAGLITEDPDEVKEGPEEPDPKTTSPKAKKQHNWPYESIFEFEELEAGDTLYNGMFVVGANYEEGEEEVQYHRDGSGTPGTPGGWEWEITDAYDIEGYDGEGNEIEVDPEADKQKIIDALNTDFQENEEKMQDLLNNDNEQPEDDGDRQYEAMRDRDDRKSDMEQW